MGELGDLRRQGGLAGLGGSGRSGRSAGFGRSGGSGGVLPVRELWEEWRGKGIWFVRKAGKGLGEGRGQKQDTL